MASKLIRPASRLFKGYANKTSLVKPSRLRSTEASYDYGQALMNYPATRFTTLPNKVRVTSEDTDSPTATVGIWINTGSRFENDDNNGVAHFLEHMAFKGTAKRSQTALELEIENMGAHLNAYTSREHTVFYAKCFSEDVPKCVEILTDIIQNSTFGEAEIERERGVILREMQEVESNMQEVVFDYLHSVAYQGTPLARTILGPTENIKKMSRNDLVTYIKQNYRSNRIVLAGAGGVSHDQLVGLAGEYLGGLTPETMEEVSPGHVNCRYTGSDVRVREDDMPLCYVAYAVEGAGWNNPDNIPLMIATTIVGSWDRTHGGGHHNASQVIRSAAGGMAHSVQSFNTCYNDTGLWGVYFVTEALNIDEFIFNIHNEWMKLCSSITEFEVERAKNMLRTNLLLQLDGTTAVCEDIGRQTLSYGRRIPVQELDARISALNAEDVMEACYKYIYDRCPVAAAVGPCEALPDYNRLRAGHYWLRI